MLQPESAGRPLSDGLDTSKNSVAGFFSFLVEKFGTARVAGPAEPGAVQRKYPKPSGYNKYTLAEVARHNTPDDAWLVIEDKVYDVSGMQHPGGPVLFSYAGRDATELFNVMHKNQPLVRGYLKTYLIGELATPNKDAMLRDFNSMLHKFEQQGLMDASSLFYVRKVVELLALAAGALYLNMTFPTSIVAVLFSAFLMANQFYQCGWCQHDFQHNQVFRSHKKNASLGGLIIGLGIGGSAHWWKTKHNQHHATPNKMDGDSKNAVDPDIDTVPLIAWSEDLLKQVPRSERHIISVQHVLVWPLLLVALVNWQLQSLLHALTYPGIPAALRRKEVGMIVAHHLLVGWISFWPLGFKLGLLHWCLSHAMGGFVTAFVFIQSHNAMEIYNTDLDFVTSQMVSTRNINPGVVADWIMGGLNYQIEHHLFPTMPRHSFSRVRKEVMQFCARHGLPYESVTIWESTVKVYRQLAAIARLA